MALKGSFNGSGKGSFKGSFAGSVSKDAIRVITITERVLKGVGFLY